MAIDDDIHFGADPPATGVTSISVATIEWIDKPPEFSLSSAMFEGRKRLVLDASVEKLSALVVWERKPIRK